MIKRLSIGIDPGWNSGAVALIFEFKDGREVLEVHQFSNMAEVEQADLFYELMLMKCPKKAVLEKVWGKRGDTPSTAGKLCESHGALKMALMMGKISFSNKAPQTWMKMYGMKKKDGESSTQWKTRLWQKAKELYPETKFNKPAGDAVLLAHYCKHKNW